MSKNKCRLFITENEENFHSEKHFQIFSFSQIASDGSIYVSSPSFSKVKWVTLSQNSEKPEVIVSDFPNKGKLSIHGLGQAHIKAHDSDAPPNLRVDGLFLKDEKRAILGVRHLFTALIERPEYLPGSAAFNRQNDYSIKTKTLKPTIFVFWALPRTQNLQVEFNCSFNADELESDRPDNGMGMFNLESHSILWFAYRTKNMDKWPKVSYISYHDGYSIPIFIGNDNGNCRLEFRRPNVQISEGVLKIGFLDIEAN
jgi:hypothetical protein